MTSNRLRHSERAALMGIEGAFKMQASANDVQRTLPEGRKVIHLEIGQPDYPTPPHIVEAGIRALSGGHTRYTIPEGIPQLRDAICGFLSARGVSATPDRIVVTPGGKAALYCAMVAILNEGDEVLIPDPGFPIYPSLVRSHGARIIRYPVSAAHGVRADEIERLVTPQTRILLLNAPHNPTGSSIDPAELERLAELAVRHDLWVVSDEVYATLQFDGGFRSIAAFESISDRCIIVDSLSKSHVMTGWRIGYAFIPPSLRETIIKVAVNAFSCITTFVQHAAVEALTASQQCVADMRDEYAVRTKLVADALNNVDGILCPASKGAFYVYPNVAELAALAVESRKDRIVSSTEWLVDRLLHEAHVAVLPGTDFGPSGEGYIRLSCANSRENLTEATSRIAALAQQLKPGVRNSGGASHVS